MSQNRRQNLITSTTVVISPYHPTLDTFSDCLVSEPVNDSHVTKKLTNQISPGELFECKHLWKSDLSH